MAAPIITGITDGMTYTGPVTAIFATGTGTLNGIPYTSGTLVTDNGDHILEVTDGTDTAVVRFSIASTIAQFIANVRKEVQLAYEFIWGKGLFYLAIAWLGVMFLLLAIDPSFALIASYGILIAGYFYISKPVVIETVSLWSIFVSAKEGTVEIETALPAMAGKIQGILLNAFILAFITPCTIGFLFPDMGLLTALTLVALGAGCGILNVQKLQWQGAGFYRFIFALSIGEIISIVATVVNLGNTESALAATKIIKDYSWAFGIIAFFIAMGYFGLIATKTKDGVKKTFGVIAWMITHPFKLLWIILFITIACAIFWPQSLVMGSKFIKDQQAIALVDAQKAGFVIPEVKLPESKDAPEEKSKAPTEKPVDESQWEKVGETKTCEVAWNNADFTNGWCSLGEFPAGEYRFEVKSTLKFKGLDNTSDLIPQEGVSINRWHDAANTDFVTHFKTWTPVKNDILGSVIFKTNGDTPATNSNFNIKQKNTVYISINFPQSQDNWEKMGFNGSITVVIFKKKS